MHTVKWMGESVSILDQRKLPLQEIYNDYGNYIGVAEAIRSMEVRGAPAIGITAAMGIALAAKNFKGRDLKDFRETMDGVLLLFAETRPTAVNLFWAIERMRSLVSSGSDIDSIIDALVMEAVNILEEDIAINRTMGKNGSRFLSDGDVVMTHCNAGSLATGGYGTALGVIRAAVEEGKKIEVIACETRPYLQGARLTAWELQKDNIPVTVITDNMAGFFMKKGLVKKIIVGADRVAANGDTANKIGTYSHAVLARHHGIPFYVAAPVSTLDINTHTGGDIVIEERSVDEVAYVGSVQIVPEGVRIYNPAFDVTPAELISAIITEKGVIEEPAGKGISSLVSA
ncbi:MAG: S-methyl-5-thioribose-1-phosphate isomerase [Spirochaetae bacterium HGW-Spirochaetae-1]|nr:MAG: S-methyl-5-thioribose-1-phosphate isomerase [Spirochaetae bacterium HGW-Spirochaetae-1]